MECIPDNIKDNFIINTVMRKYICDERLIIQLGT